MAKWAFSIAPDDGKRHYYTIEARDKTEAVKKGLEKTRKSAKIDLSKHWHCKLQLIKA